MPEEKLKLKNLEERIDAAKDQIADKNSPNIKPSQLGKVMKLVVEIVAAMAIGIGIGLILDNYFNTRPLFTIIFFLLGSLAGILNVFRVAKSMQNN
ncbi:AtpZ/AtpI family protein [Pelagibacteraceae bacterium]|nr:AtpZ/AtpI family protein [Pelagibacteraceae bacterium]